MKKIITLAIILVGLVFGGIYFYTNNSNNKNKENEFQDIKKAKIQVILVDIMTEHIDFIKQESIQIGTIINLSEFGGNDVEILDVNDEGVKISREAVRYEILSQSSQYEGEVREFTETVVEFVKYNTSIPINIDSRHPFGPEYSQPRYQYSIQFVK